jgi:hypothetical protein
LGAVACAAAAYGAYAIISGYFNGFGQAQSAMDNYQGRTANQQRAIECMFNPKGCSENEAQQCIDKARQQGQNGVSDTAAATRSLGTSIPGTTMSGPLPTSIPDLVGTGVTSAVGNTIP